VPPDLTIVTPTLNAVDYLSDCLASIRRESGYASIEHIVVDDGSTDGTLDRLRDSGCLLLEGRRKGLYDAMNLGLDAASGDVVGVLNGDDYLLPGAVERLNHAFLESGRDWAVGGLRWVDADGHSLGSIAAPPEWLPLSWYASLGWSWIHHQTTYMKKTLWQSLGGFDTSLRVAADYDLLARALQRGRFARIKHELAVFRRHGSNVSMTDSAGASDNAAIRSRYGPREPALAMAAGIAAKAFVNARNPRWSYVKLSSRIDSWR